MTENIETKIAPGDAAWPLQGLQNISHLTSAEIAHLGAHDHYEWAGQHYARTGDLK